MTAQVVTNTLTLPNGDAAAGARVTVSLVASTTGHGEGFTSTVGIAYETTAVADSSGVWSVSLTPNSLITPADTVYKVVEQFGQTRVVNHISVPASGTPHLLGAILSDAPASIASAALSTHMVDATAAHAASAVAFTPTGSIAASTVQAAVAEVATDYIAADAAAVVTANATYALVPAPGGPATNDLSALGIFYPEKYGVCPGDSTDVTAYVQAAITAAEAVGGTVMLMSKRYTCLSGLTLPNDGGTPSAQQRPIRICGDVGRYGVRGNAGGSTLDLRGGVLAKIVTKGHGLLEIDHLTILDGGSSSLPYIFTTNTTVRAHDLYVQGNTSKTGATCDQTFLLAGGTTIVEGNADDAPFQGYGTAVQNCYFDRMRRIVHGRTYANSLNVRDNTIWATCGGSEAILFEGLTTAVCGGNVTSGNLIELTNYTYGIRWVNCQGNAMIADQFWDTSTAVACVRYEGLSYFNTFMPAQVNGPALAVSDTTNPGTSANTVISTLAASGAAYSEWGQPQQHLGQLRLYSSVTFGTLASGAKVAPDVSLSRIGANRLQCDQRFEALGSDNKFGPATNLAAIGSLGTADVWVDASGSNTNISLRLRAKGTGVVQVESMLRLNSQKIQLGAFATGSRPAQSIGAVVWDSTLAQPIYSDGTNWRSFSTDLVV